MTTSKRMTRGRVLMAAGLALGSGICMAWAESTWAQDANPTGGEASARNALAAFQAFTQYPPESQPLTSSSWDLLHPWTVDATWLPLLSQQAASQLESAPAAA